MAPVITPGISDIVVYTLGIWLVWKFFSKLTGSGIPTGTTPLKGPKRLNLLFGYYRFIREQQEPGLVYEKWAQEYGPAFVVPGPLGTEKIVICDPKACTHFYLRETFTYVQSKLARDFIQNLIGRGLFWAEGEAHKRQRRSLSPAFSNIAIRRSSAVFYDSAHKLTNAWDAILDNEKGDSVMIEVQKWMNHISLDSIGIAGFGHDFGTLDGKNSDVVDAFNSFDNDAEDTGFFSRIIFLLGPVFPNLQLLPTKNNRIVWRWKKSMGEIADELLERSREVKDSEKEDSAVADNSIIGLLIRSENAGTQLQISSEEVMAQMNMILLAGYETTSISLTWSLVELCRNPEKQAKLREEVMKINGDPTWEQLTSGLPYLDAVVYETLRLHPPVVVTDRVASVDDIIPFSQPIQTASGELVDKLVVAKGTHVTAPIATLNKMEALWGKNGKQFEPERWLEDSDGKGCNNVETTRAKELQGHRHILTFSDGPRICQGRVMAITEFKIVLAIMIRHYTFELPDGPETRIEKHASILPRPKVKGYGGAQVPLKIRRVDADVDSV